MSYISSFVQAQPATKIVAADQKSQKAVQHNVITRNNIATKILLFAAIITCLVLAINI